MKIIIQTIPHSEMRYDTCGDYWEENGIMKIRVSDMGNDDYSFLVAIHEMIEQHLCKKRGITEESITHFDIEFEKNREKGNDDEPGDDPRSPYKREHFFATTIERLVASELGVDWQEYEKEINILL